MGNYLKVIPGGERKKFVTLREKRLNLREIQEECKTRRKREGDRHERQKDKERDREKASESD